MVLVWCAVLAGTYWYFVVKPQQWFDPQMQAPPVLAEPGEPARLRAWLQQRYPDLRAEASWFVRWRQGGCGCERFVELHHQSFAAQTASDQASIQAGTPPLQVITVEWDALALSPADRAWLQGLIPATPAVTLFNPAGALIYFGPYHQDGICSAENSYLEPVLAALQAGQSLTVLNTLVFGCFCHTR